ncbi:similar to An18g02150 [Aspergillus luchuensis]|uniref:Similar to An18g02150 n=1 Tax=Aspergillus kawachii TaxID=1069201 RepID=A0A146F0V8_ASPKA|nr:similar to An18g02150 [Aspergillus luchuensis]
MAVGQPRIRNRWFSGAPAPLPSTHPGARANHPWPRIHPLQLRLAKLGADDVIPDESEAFGTLSVAPVWSPLPARVRLRALNGHPGGVGRNF